MITTLDSKMCKTFFQTFSKAYLSGKSFEIKNMRTFEIKLTINSSWCSHYMALFHLVPFLSLHIRLSILQCGKRETEYQYYSWSKGLVYHGEGRKLNRIHGYFRFKELLNEVMPFSNIYTSSHKK